MKNSRCIVLYAISTFCGLMFASAGGCGYGVQPLWSQAKPETVLKVDPIRRTVMVHNSKDVDVTLDEFSGTTRDGTTWLVRNLRFSDNASGVRTANVAQLEVVKSITEIFVRELFSGLAKNNPLAGATVSLDSPLGQSAITTGGGEAPMPAKVEPEATVEPTGAQ